MLENGSRARARARCVRQATSTSCGSVTPSGSSSSRSSAESELAGTEQAAWLDRLEREFDNLAAALEWLLASGRAEDALRAISALERFWRAHAHVSEARRWLSLGLSLAAGALPADVRAAALRTAALQAAAQSDWGAARADARARRASCIRRSAVRLCDEIVSPLVSQLRRARCKTTSTSHEQFAQEAVAGRQVGSTTIERIGRRPHGARRRLLGSRRARRSRVDAGTSEAVALESRGRRPAPDRRMPSTTLAWPRSRRATRSRPRRFRRALDIARALGEVPYMAAAQFMLAELDLLDGRRRSTHASARARASTLYTELEDDRSSRPLPRRSCGRRCRRGRHEDAARLVGAADALRGDERPDEFETPVLERPHPSSRPRSGGRLAELKAEGSLLGRGRSSRGCICEHRGVVSRCQTARGGWRWRRGRQNAARRRSTAYAERKSAEVLADEELGVNSRTFQEGMEIFEAWHPVEILVKTRPHRSVGEGLQASRIRAADDAQPSGCDTLLGVAGLVLRLEAAELGDRDVGDDSGQVRPSRRARRRVSTPSTSSAQPARPTGPNAIAVSRRSFTPRS